MCFFFFYASHILLFLFHFSSVLCSSRTAASALTSIFNLWQICSLKTHGGLEKGVSFFAF